MSWVQIAPRYQELLRRRGLAAAADFLQLPGIILCGHADRHVLQVDDASIPFGLFLKKEHRVPWRERLASYFAGFGLVSRSRREGRQLELLRDAGIGCPEVVAIGEKKRQAFLLLREQPGIDLRTYASQNTEPARRRELARALGVSLAKMHAAGFVHPDLYAKHVLVQRDGKLHFSFLDWQRSRPPHPLTWRERLGNLAALDASLAANLAGNVDRLVCLRAYLHELARWQANTAAPTVISARVAISGVDGRLKLPRPKSTEEYSLRNVLLLIRGLRAPLQKRTRLRELHQAPLPRGQQNLIWLDGERLCITQQLRQQHARDLPEILELLRTPPQLAREVTYLNASTLLRLVKERSHGLGRWLHCKLSGRTYASDAFAAAALTFRLERHGLTPPRILALGQRFVKPWRCESFLLTEEPVPTTPLQDFLLEAKPRQRWQVLRQAGILIHRLHQTGCRLTDLSALGVHVSETPCVILINVTGLRRGKRGFQGDLARIWKSLKACCTQADLLRFLLAYQGQPERFHRHEAPRTLHDVTTRKVPA